MQPSRVFEKNLADATYRGLRQKGLGLQRSNQNIPKKYYTTPWQRWGGRKYNILTANSVLFTMKTPTLWMYLL